MKKAFGWFCLGMIATLTFPANARDAGYVILQSVENQFGRLLFNVQYSDGEQKQLSAAEARAQFNSFCPRVRIAPGAFRE